MTPGGHFSTDFAPALHPAPSGRTRVDDCADPDHLSRLLSLA